MSQPSEAALFSFSLLPQKQPPWKQFVLTMCTEAVAVLALAWVGVLHPEVLIPPKHDYQTIALVSTPAPVNHEPAPVRVIKPTIVPAPVPARVEALRVPPQEVRRKALQP